MLQLPLKVSKLFAYGQDQSAVVQLVERLTWDQTFDSSRLTAGGVTVLCPLARHFIHCLVLVQPRKTCPDMTKKLLTGT